jgi:molybdate transport system substrate-binding protein
MRRHCSAAGAAGASAAREMDMRRVSIEVAATVSLALCRAATSYTAAVIAAAPNPDGAKAFLGYLASPDGRALFAQNGISD